MVRVPNRAVGSRRAKSKRTGANDFHRPCYDARVTIATVSKSFKFQASHQLLHHDGPCRHLHGHSYEVEVFAEGAVNNTPGQTKEGMVVDYGDISGVWKRTLFPRLDHRHLNSSIEAELKGPTTAENLAEWILSVMRHYIPEVNQVTVHETDSSSATVYATY